MLLEGRLGFLARGGDWSQRWAHGQLSATLPLGVAFAITWTPCIGPVLGVILTLAASTAELQEGVMLLAVYSLGLALPFLALSLSVDRVRGWSRRFAREGALVRAAAGVVLVLMGAGSRSCLRPWPGTRRLSGHRYSRYYRCVVLSQEAMSQWLPYLLLLACPISMGLMMWLMMRMDPHRNMPAADPRIAELESQVAELRSELVRRRDDRQAHRHAETDVGSSREG